MLVTAKGQLAKMGASTSRTKTVNEQLATSALLLAVQVTILVPTLKLCGEVMTTFERRHVTTGAGTPETVTVNATLLPKHWPGVFDIVRLPGQAMVGGMPCSSTAPMSTAEP